MIDKKTVFVLGAGASCPYGYPSGAQLRTEICLRLKEDYSEYRIKQLPEQKNGMIKRKLQIAQFVDAFDASSTRSIDLFMSRNRTFAETGKYIIAYKIFTTEHRSCFREQITVKREEYEQPLQFVRRPCFIEKGYFQGDDWYLYLFNRLTADLTTPEVLPDFSDGKIAFITFNYDRSLEHFLYESLSKSFTEVPELETEIVKCLKKLKILHVYGQISPFKWQDSEHGVDYRPQINESLLQKSAANIRTIYEEKQNPELVEAQNLLKQAEQIFFLGFGYAPENMEVLGLPEVIPPIYCQVYGTALGLNGKEVKSIRDGIIEGLRADDLVGFKNKERIKIENKMDCLELLRNYL